MIGLVKLALEQIIELPENQMKLAEAIFGTDKQVTVILVTGRAMAIPKLDKHADAILNVWMGGVEAGNALADIVHGKVSPAGRLPINFPRKTGQVSFTYSETQVVVLLTLISQKILTVQSMLKSLPYIRSAMG